MQRESSPAEVVVVADGGTRWELGPGDMFTFGRAPTCSACLDPDDLGLSRVAGSLEHEAGTWWLLNRSTARPLSVTDELGLRSLLAPGRRMALVGPVTVVAEGSARRHALEIAATSQPPPPSSAADPESDERPTTTDGQVVVNDRDRLALVAMFAGYLEPFPRHSPYPRSYADAAADLGWPRTTLVKRIEYLRTRLSDAGVPNLFGEAALQHLAEWALTTRVITRQDLSLLSSK